MDRQRLRRVAARALVVLEWVYASVLIALALLTHRWELDWFGLWLIATFLPYWFIPGLLVAVWTLLRRNPRRHLPGLAVAACFLLLYGRQLVPRPTPDSSRAVTVMTHNLAGLPAGVEPALTSITTEQPHLLALQEIRPRRSDRRDLLSRLEESGYQCEHRPYYADTGFGVAICVRPPVGMLQAQRRTYHEQGEWSYLFAEVAWQHQVVNVVVPHLLSYRLRGVDDGVTLLRRVLQASRWHRQETAALLDLIGTFRDPTLMLGDFNSTPEHAIHPRIRRQMRDAFAVRGLGFGATYRFVLPIRIDYVYASPGLEVLEARVGSPAGSDHRSVVVRLQLTEEGLDLPAASPLASAGR